MLARQIRRLRPGLLLLQHPDNLIFREPCSLHLSVLQEGRTLNPHGGESQWQVTDANASFCVTKSYNGALQIQLRQRRFLASPLLNPVTAKNRNMSEMTPP